MKIYCLQNIIQVFFAFAFYVYGKNPFLTHIPNLTQTRKKTRSKLLSDYHCALWKEEKEMQFLLVVSQFIWQLRKNSDKKSNWLSWRYIKLGTQIQNCIEQEFLLLFLSLLHFSYWNRRRSVEKGTTDITRKGLTVT